MSSVSIHGKYQMNGRTTIGSVGYGGNRNSSISTDGNNTIRIDGKEYKGKHVVINDDGIFIDGKEIKPDGDNAPPRYKCTEIVIDGPLKGNVDAASAPVTVRGNVDGYVNTMSGSVKVEETITGYVKTMSGSVHAKTIQGGVSTMSGSVSKSFK
jgi:hypothetical protein